MKRRKLDKSFCFGYILPKLTLPKVFDLISDKKLMIYMLSLD
jgi:hypothetical protein